MCPPQGVWIIFPIFASQNHTKTQPAWLLSAQPWIGNPPVPPMATNGSSTKRPRRFRWNFGMPPPRLGPRNHVAALCWIVSGAKKYEASKLHLVFSRAAGQMKFRQLSVSNFFPFGLSLNCNVCLYYINCIHFWTLYKSTKEQIPQLKKLPLGMTIHESRSCSFSDIAMAELVGTPGQPFVSKDNQQTSTENQNKKIFGRTIFWS